LDLFHFTHESLDVFPSHLLPLSPFCPLLPCATSFCHRCTSPRPPRCRAPPSTSCSPSPRVARSLLPPLHYPRWLALAPPCRADTPERPPCNSDKLPSPSFLSPSSSFAQSRVKLFPKPFLHFSSQTSTYPRWISTSGSVLSTAIDPLW
jgi:hypothetical protein